MMKNTNLTDQPPKKERTTFFITIYLPKHDETLRNAFRQKTHQDGTSMSGQLLKLIAADLERLEVLSFEEAESIKTFTFGKPTNVKNTRITSNYSFYIPKELWWIVNRIDQNLNGKIPFKSRSKYIWSLFSKEFLPENHASDYFKTRSAG